jgi:hypothetical protein
VNKPVLYIHVGSHKTGTTAIQQAMRAARDELRQQGVCWPVLRSKPEHSKLAHSKLVRVVYAEGLVARAQSRWLAARVRWQARGLRTTVLSSEKIYRVGYEFFEGVAQDTPENRGRRVAFLQRLRALFADHFDIKVLLYLRRVDEFAESMYKEQLFRKPYTGRFRFEDFLAEQRALFNYGDQVQELQQYLGPVSLQSYDAARKAGLVEHFCALVGVTPPRQPGPGERVRRSASNTAALFLNRLAEERSLTRADRLQVQEFSLSGRMLEPADGARSLWPSRESLESFMQQYRNPALDHLFPAVDWDHLRFGGMESSEYQSNLAAFEEWRRSGGGELLASRPGTSEPHVPDGGLPE